MNGSSKAFGFERLNLRPFKKYYIFSKVTDLLKSKPSNTSKSQVYQKAKAHLQWLCDEHELYNGVNFLGRLTFLPSGIIVMFQVVNIDLIHVTYFYMASDFVFLSSLYGMYWSSRKMYQLETQIYNTCKEEDFEREHRAENPNTRLYSWIECGRFEDVVRELRK